MINKNNNKRIWSHSPTVERVLVLKTKLPHLLTWGISWDLDVLIIKQRQFFKRFYLRIFREEKEGKHQCVVASSAHSTGDWLKTQACALTGNWTSDPLVHRPVLNPLSHTSQGQENFYFKELLLGSHTVIFMWKCFVDYKIYNKNVKAYFY